ncbi:hypothetical protein FD754_008587, partial [Muntiacus muntjak]
VWKESFSTHYGTFFVHDSFCSNTPPLDKGDENKPPRFPIYSLIYCSPSGSSVHGILQARLLEWVANSFQVDSKGTQPYIYMYPFSPKFPSHPGCHTTLSRHHNIFFIIVIILIINTYQLCSHYFLGIFSLGGEMGLTEMIIPFPFCDFQSFPGELRKKNILSGLSNVVWILVHSPLRLALLNPWQTGAEETSLTNSSLSIPPSFRRFTRSNSVTTAVQADLDFHDNLENSLESIEDNSCPGPVARQFSRDASTSTVSIQGSGNHYHACAVDEDFDADFDPSILPPPDPWIDSITEDPLEAVQRSVCHRDGHWFLKLLQAERDRMEGWCQQMEREERENNLPEEILGKIRTAVGSAQLLMAQKFYQFRELCEENLNPNAHPRPTSQDLAGFWDMLQLSIENISMKFDELHQLKANNWKQMDPLDKKERRAPPPVPKKPAKGPAPLIRERSLESSQRQEARKRLMAAKRAASVRQNSATESAESIEIYIPEAQTRL